MQAARQVQWTRRLGATVVVMTFALMVLGSWVKATGSGLACPDWPQCYGEWLPPFPSAENGGTWQGEPVHYSQAMVLYEWGHRLLASLLAPVLLAFAIVAIRGRSLHPTLRFLPALAGLVLVIQIGIGGATVLQGNPAATTTLHLATATFFFFLVTLAAAFAFLRPLPGPAVARIVKVVPTGPPGARTTEPSRIGLFGGRAIAAGQAGHAKGTSIGRGLAHASGAGPSVGAGLSAGAASGAMPAGATGGAMATGAASHAARSTDATRHANMSARASAHATPARQPAKQAGLQAGGTGAAGTSGAMHRSEPLFPGQPAPHEPAVGRPAMAVVNDFVAISKPRIILLLLIVAWAAMFVAARGFPPLGPFLAVTAAGTFSTAASGAFNNVIEIDRDRRMGRTANRPLAAGRIQKSSAIVYAVVMTFLALAALSLIGAWLAALLTAGAVGYYVIVYTVWLKPTTPQNIVIGGLAGSFPAVIGWSAVTGTIAWPAIVIAGLVFLWTPPHFWALALLYKKDYAAADYPMMPNIVGEHKTRRMIIVYSALTFVASLSLVYPLADAGIIYLAGALVFGLVLVFRAGRLETHPSPKAYRSFFLYTIQYLGFLLVVLMVDQVWFRPLV